MLTDESHISLYNLGPLMVQHWLSYNNSNTATDNLLGDEVVDPFTENLVVLGWTSTIYER